MLEQLQTGTNTVQELFHTNIQDDNKVDLDQKKLLERHIVKPHSGYKRQYVVVTEDEFTQAFVRQG